MKALIHSSSSGQFPALFVADPKARSRMRDFFTAHIRNPNTRRAYRNALLRFSEWCQAHGIGGHCHGEQM